MDSQMRESASHLFGALSNSTRIRIVEILVPGEHTVNEIAEALGIGQSGTSQHLAILARSGVVVAEQRGASKYYRIRGPRIVRILNLIEEFCHIHGLGIDEENREGVENGPGSSAQ
jgi:DNA-binding transcriptional ArsR family regulator